MILRFRAGVLALPLPHANLKECDSIIIQTIFIHQHISMSQVLKVSYIKIAKITVFNALQILENDRKLYSCFGSTVQATSVLTKASV